MKILRTLCCTLLLVLSISRTGVASASTLIATAPAITAYSQQVVARNHNRLYVPAAIPAVPVYPVYATTAYATYPTTYPTTAYGYPRYGYGYYPTYGYGYSYASVPTTALWR